MKMPHPSKLLACLIVLALSGCWRSTGLPAPDSKEYRVLVSAFYVGLAGLQTGEDSRAREKLSLATQIAPGEPAGWANLGLLDVRQQDFDNAYKNVNQARSLAPENSRLEALLGLIESKRGNLPESVEHFKKAVTLDGRNLKALYSLAQESERQGASDGESLKLLESILSLDPGNTAVLIDRIRLAAKAGDSAAVNQALVILDNKSKYWPDEAKRQLASLQQTANSNIRAAAAQSAFLKNVLARVPEYRRSLDDVRTPPEFVGDPFTRFIRLPSPSVLPAAPDLTLRFSSQPVSANSAATGVMILPLDSEKAPSMVFVDDTGIQIEGGARISVAGPRHVVGFDFDYDFRTDLVVLTDSGIRVYHQDNINSFTDVTGRTLLPAAVIKGRYEAAFTFDYDLDGDLDLLICSATVTRLLRNNGDGTFREIPFPGRATHGIHSVAAADIDGDGDPDLAVVDETGLRILINERLGQYQERALPSGLGAVACVAAADIDGDGLVDFVTLTREGRIVRLSDRIGEWVTTEISKVSSPVGPVSEVALLIADFDNNGSLDILAEGSGLLLSDGKGGFTPIELPSGFQAKGVFDANGDNRLDLIGMQGGPIQLINSGTANYHSQTIRTRAAKSTGDQRINSFGIGGEIEIRSGLLTQKQVINSPWLHFGLGENLQTDVARIVWPNGSVQAEFELKAGQSILAEQRLKGSCPMLFAWDGTRMSYVKDTAPWSPALGLHINAQVVAGIGQTQEWFRIRGDQLGPRDGYYDLRVTAELWETYYIDHYSLMVVDHPRGTEVFTDERFAVPAPPLRLYAVRAPRQFASATDDRGSDVSGVVAALDRSYLDSFGKGRYQGIVRDHWVELELPADAPAGQQLYLIGHGFLHPTDGSINVAYGQGNNQPPQGLTIEIPGKNGEWKVAKPGLGFPAGKLKQVVIDLKGVVGKSNRRFRMRTNMEIYWDKLEWAAGLPELELKIKRVDAGSAELRYRGFSSFSQANDSSPEIPDYNRLAGTAQKWRDLVGYYTRFGDVRELLNKIDDRMVIMNAGDELRLRFAALPEPGEGWVRDYIMVGDGWIKDGDLNSTFSKTVLPVPYHGLKDYVRPPRDLEDDPAYRLHPGDWEKYHTRYVTPERFLQALR